MVMTTKYQQALLHIIAAEKKYGSLSQTPEDDSDLIAARNILGEENEDLDVLDIKILKLIKAGYLKKDIIQRLKVNHTRVEKVKDLNHLSFKPIFKYKVTKDDEFIGYSSTLNGIAKLIDLHTIGNFEFISSNARAKGYQVKEVHLLWRDIPDDCIYTAKNKPLYVKRGLDSWLKYEILKWRG